MDVVQLVLDVLARMSGRRVLDVGCGSGRLAARLRAAGVAWTGLDPQGGAGIVTGVAEALPLPDASVDLVLFQNALHHVPEAAMDAALAEAVRVLAPGGRVLVIEPAVEGALSQVIAVVDDEGAVRAAAQAALARATGPGGPLLRDWSDRPLRHERFADFEAFRTSMLSVDPARADRARARADALHSAFLRHAVRGPEGFTLAQPMLVDLLRPA